MVSDPKKIRAFTNILPRKLRGKVSILEAMETLSVAITTVQVHDSLNYSINVVVFFSFLSFKTSKSSCRLSFDVIGRYSISFSHLIFIDD
jgi:hypothetical protein